MQAIFVPMPLEGYELCHPVDPSDFETINLAVNGESRAEAWRSPRMRIVCQDQGQDLLSSDSPWLGGHALVFRSGILLSLRALLESYGELLPLACDGADVTIYNVTRVIDALDETASSVTRFESGRIMMVKRYLFRPEVVREIDIFKIPNLRVSPTFVSRRFVDTWASSKGTGLSFKQVWAPH